MKPRLLYLVSVDWYFVSHRLQLALAAKEAGFDVAVATRVMEHGERIQDEGLKLLPISLERAGLNPVREWGTVRSLSRLYKSHAPDLVHNVTVKPVIYGSIAARGARTEGVVNAIMGLGWVFSSDSPRARALRPVVTGLLRRALSMPNSRTIVQNTDDAALLTKKKLALEDSIRLIRGSGVDPAKYAAEPPADEGVPLVVLPARMLIAKGVREFMQAAAQLRAEGSTARFALVGKPDDDNVASVKLDEIERNVAAGHVEYWGWREDMPEVLKQASIVCLPTFYGEGLPKSLLEAAASSRPIITTDVPGCRELVRPGENGWLIPPRDVTALTDALREALARQDLRRQYGSEGRRTVEREFSLDAVIKATLGVYDELIPGLSRS